MRAMNEEFFDLYTEQDELWKKEGRYTIQSKKWLLPVSEIAREAKERWLLERKRCPYCDVYKWPEEMDRHTMLCGQRF